MRECASIIVRSTPLLKFVRPNCFCLLTRNVLGSGVGGRITTWRRGVLLSTLTLFTSFYLFIFSPFTREFLRNLLQTRLFPNSLILFEGIIFFFCLFCVWWRLYCSVIAQWVVFISVCLRYKICFYFICTAFVHLLLRKFTKFFKGKIQTLFFIKH